MPVIRIDGLASGKSWDFNITQEDLELNVLNFLRLKQLPVASSCDGEAICRLCIINDDILACNTLVKDIISKYNSNITINYL